MLYSRHDEFIQFPYVYGEELFPQHYGNGLTSHVIATGQPLLLAALLPTSLVSRH